MMDYELSDFVDARYQDLPQYADCMGISIDLVRELHESHVTHESSGQFGSDHAWFMHRSRETIFDLYVYETNAWSQDMQILMVEPLVRIHGTTHDGVRATWFSDTEPSNLHSIADALIAADEELRRRGWTLE